MSCDWPVDRSCLPALPPEDDDGYELALIRRTAAEDLAVNVLWALSGRQFGICPAMARPCAPSGVCGDRGTVVGGGVMVDFLWPDRCNHQLRATAGVSRAVRHG